jgi:hypothetical protein
MLFSYNRSIAGIRFYADVEEQAASGGKQKAKRKKPAKA